MIGDRPDSPTRQLGSMLGQQQWGTWGGRLRGSPTVVDRLPVQVGKGGGEGHALYGELVALTGTVTIPAGGGGITSMLDTIVEQVGFGKVTAAGDPVILPHTAIYVIQIDVRYTDGYRGGGTIEVTLDGA